MIRKVWFPKKRTVLLPLHSILGGGISISRPESNRQERVCYYFGITDYPKTEESASDYKFTHFGYRVSLWTNLKSEFKVRIE